MGHNPILLIEAPTSLDTTSYNMLEVSLSEKTLDSAKLQSRNLLSTLPRSILCRNAFPVCTTWRFRGSYKWGYKHTRGLVTPLITTLNLQVLSCILCSTPILDVSIDKTGSRSGRQISPLHHTSSHHSLPHDPDKCLFITAVGNTRSLLSAFVTTNEQATPIDGGNQGTLLR